MIDNNESLAEICRHFTTSRYITIDTEFIREKTFWPELCLIQVAMPGREVLIDPLADGLDLTPLFALLKNKDVIKVMHGCRQDIEIFYRLDGVIPAPLADTQIMAMVCGFGDAASYATLVHALAHAKIDKTSRFTDWSRRPLSERQLTYALADVTHLRDIFEQLEIKLTQNNRTHWVEEEMTLLTDEKTYQQLPANAWQRIKIGHAHPAMLGVLMKVAEWRDGKAQSKNVPRQRILKDDTVREIATQLPDSLQAFEKLRSFPKGMTRSQYMDELVDAVTQGKNLSFDELPSLPKAVNNRSGIAPLVELLKVLLKHKCTSHKVAPKLLANTNDLERIASDFKPDVRAMHGWRYEVFGRDALRLKNGEIALACQKDEVVVVECAPATAPIQAD